MKETVLERMERIDAPRRIADFNVKMQMPYAFKKSTPPSVRGSLPPSVTKEG